MKVKINHWQAVATWVRSTQMMIRNGISRTLIARSALMISRCLVPIASMLAMIVLHVTRFSHLKLTVEGACSHTFHLHCIYKWLKDK